ncbi:MAG: hypothetical protein N2C14_06150 [Planctomycetales bacterium]
MHGCSPLMFLTKLHDTSILRDGTKTVKRVLPILWKSLPGELGNPTDAAARSRPKTPENHEKRGKEKHHPPTRPPPSPHWRPLGISAVSLWEPANSEVVLDQVLLIERLVMIVSPARVMTDATVACVRLGGPRVISAAFGRELSPRQARCNSPGNPR